MSKRNINEDFAPAPANTKRKHQLPEVGTRFGALVVCGPCELRWDPSSRQRHSMVPCRCDCGEESFFYPANLRTTRSTACRFCGREKRHKPRPICIDCGKSIGRKRTRCSVCAKKANGAAAFGRPKCGNPITLREAGEKLGVTRQQVWNLVQKFGWPHVLARIAALSPEPRP